MNWFSAPKCDHEWNEAACTYSESIKNYEFDEDVWQDYTLEDMLKTRSIIQNGQTTIEFQCLQCGDHYQTTMPGKRIK